MNGASEHSRSYVAKSDRDKKKGIKTKTSKLVFQMACAFVLSPKIVHNPSNYWFVFEFHLFGFSLFTQTN